MSFSPLPGILSTDSYILKNANYWMYLIVNEYFENYKPFNQFLTLLENFAKSLGEKALLVTPTQGSYHNTKNQVLNLNWEIETKNELTKDKNPILLIVSKPLMRFNPQSDEFIILTFPKIFDSPEQYITLFEEIEQEISEGNDMFEWRNKNSLKERKSRMIKKILESIEAKPGVFGFKIDLKKILS